MMNELLLEPPESETQPDEAKNDQEKDNKDNKDNSETLQKKKVKNKTKSLLLNALKDTPEDQVIIAINKWAIKISLLSSSLNAHADA